MDCYKAVHNTYLHYAQILRRGSQIAIARNTIGTRSKGCGWDAYSLHAERAVVKRLGDTSQLRGCVLVVVRINHQDKYLQSKPCHGCTKFLSKCIKKYGLLRVEYSNSDDTFTTLRS